MLKSDLYPLLRSKAFSKLRCGGEADLTASELAFLKSEFAKIYGGEKLSLSEMIEKAYELTKIEVTT